MTKMVKQLEYKDCKFDEMQNMFKTEFAKIQVQIQSVTSNQSETSMNSGNPLTFGQAIKKTSQTSNSQNS